MTVTAITSHSKYETRISAGANSIIADETLANGGGGLGFNPHELLAASLASCTSITLRMYADRKAMDLQEIKVEVGIENNKETSANTFNVAILLTGNISEEQKSRLLEIANLCPIHKVLEGVTYINTSII